MAEENRIAVIGMSCRLPGGSDDPESLWSLLAEGRNGMREVPKDRWNWKSFYHADPDTKDSTNFSHAYFLDRDLAAFDARFFGVAGAEAGGIDPQQRMALEIAYEAIENAGIPLESLRGSNTSVHMAMFARDYNLMGYKDLSQLHKMHLVGTGEAILANRISYLLDLRGTSNTLDTGCVSTSRLISEIFANEVQSGGLVAFHQACTALRSGESTIALAGASQLLLTPDQCIAMT
jgi:acyl transferase domain-containing protein